MHLDVVDLKAFYYRTKLGRIVQRALRDQMELVLGDTKGQTVVGFGFAAPLLRPFLKTARRVICLMPGGQGVMPWPEGMENHSVLIEETAWPIATGKVDKLIVLHGLETSEQSADLLDEIYRVLGPGGKVVFIVPNRSGLWALSDTTPFGYGRPYSVSQLETLLKAHRFLPERNFSAMFFPPSHRGFWIRFARAFEKTVLRGIIPLGAGVVIVEASKQVYAAPRSGLGEAVMRPLEAFGGVKPAGEASGRTSAKTKA